MADPRELTPAAFMAERAGDGKRAAPPLTPESFLAEWGQAQPGGGLAKLSDSLTQPADAEALASTAARAFVEAATRPVPGMRGLALPGPPRPPSPPLPWETALQTKALLPEKGPGLITGRQQTDIPNWLTNSLLRGIGRTASGVERMAEPGEPAKTEGLGETLGGAMEASTPLMFGAGLKAPLATAKALGLGTAAQIGTEKAAEKAGLPPRWQALLGSMAALGGAGWALAKIRVLKGVPRLGEANDIAARLDAVVERAKNPNLPAGERAAARAQVDALIEGLRDTEAGKPGAAPKPAALTPEAFMRQRQGQPAATIGEEASGGRTEAATGGVDAGAARPVDAGAAREGGAVHGAPAAGARPGAGEATEILVPGGERPLNARYEVRELADVRSSHHGQTFAANPDYELKNERDYSKAENQQRVIEQSSEEGFDPRYHITDNPDATNGPIVVDERGNALGGNSRTMHLQRVYGRDARAAASYRTLLEKRAAQFGIDPEIVRGMKQPVLVRAVSDAELASHPGGSKWAIRKTNVSGTAALSASERAAADAGQLSPEMVEHIAGAMEDAGPDATLNDALAGKSGTAIANRLIAEGFFSEQERPALMDGKTGALTQVAKDRIGKALLGQFFRDADQIARTPASMRNKLERIAAPLAKLGGNADYDLRPDIRDAIDAMEYKQTQGFANYRDAYGQAGMFGEEKNPVTPRSAYFAGLLEHFTPNEVTEIMRRYGRNSVPEETMFGDRYEPTPQRAMVDAVGSAIEDQKAAALKKFDTRQKDLREGGPAWEALQQERAGAAAGFEAKQREWARRADEAYAVERPQAAEVGPFGPIFHEYSGKPAEAIAKLREAQTGEVPRVWHNADLARATGTDGWIGLAWGNLRGGLAHIIDKHVERQRDLKLEDLAEMIPHMRVANRDGRSAVLESDTHRAIVRLDYDNVQKRWLASAFEKREELPTGESPVGPGAPSDRSGEPNAPPSSPSGSLSAGRTTAVPDARAAEHPLPGSGAPEESVAGGEGGVKGALKEFWGEETGTSLVGSILKADAKEALALKAKRDAALAELERAKASPEQQKYGEKTIQWFTGERDMWSARVNQVISRLRKLVPDPVEQEALSLMRDFKNKPPELARFLDGTHPALQALDASAPLTRGLPGSEYAVAMDRIRQLRPAILKALDPTPRMIKADGVLSRIAAGTLAEGQRLGILDSRWTADEYNPHILHPKGEGELPTRPAGDRLGRAIGGKMGRYFAFAEKREFPTLLDAVANNYRPQTLNAFDAFTIHGDKFATARATHLLTRQLGDAGFGVWGIKEKAPEGWVALAPHSNEFRNLVGYTDAEGMPAAAEQRLFVPQFVAKALQPITDPDYMGRIPLFRAMRMSQAFQKTVQLGLSFFHAYTENLMSLANSGVKGWAKALRADRESPEFLRAERDMIAHGGTSAIQGHTYEAYKALEPGSIPTWSDIWRRAPVAHQMDTIAGKITDFTFGNLQRRFKVTDYQLHMAAWMAEHPNATPAETAAAKHSMAKEINAVYGGLSAENLGVNRATTEVVRALMLAPDWTFSNVFNVKYAAERATPAGAMARMFWIRVMAGGLAATQAMSLMMSGKPSRNPTQVYFGKDRDGNDIYQNVFFKGAPGDAVNLVHNVYDYGAVQGLARTVAGKAAPMVRAGLQIATNRDYLGREIVPKGMNPVAGTVRAGLKTAEAVLPVPFTVSNLHDMLLGPDRGKYSVPEFLTTTFAGNPPRHVPPEGMRRGKYGLEGVPYRPDRSIGEQIRTGKP